MKGRQLHPWDVTPRDAMSIQRELASLVVRDGDLRMGNVRFVAGCDVAFDKASGRAVGSVAVLANPSLELIEEVTVETPITFPYVPGLLSFRETPVLLRAFERVRQAADLVVVDGHGYAHPRRFGYACHLGLLLDVPTIGAAKSRLVGTHAMPGLERGARAQLIHDGEVIGSVLRTRARVRPMYVSIGHRIGLAAAERAVLQLATARRMPEPTRIADRLSRVAKQRMLDATLEIVVEQRAGESGRWEWVADDDEVVFRHDLDPMPTHYGCSTELINPADGEYLDAMVVDACTYARGERVDVRVVDVLERHDGDHKLLAVPLDRPAIHEGVRERIWAWYVAHEKPLAGWGGEDAAIGLIRACRDGRPPIR